MSKVIISKIEEKLENRKTYLPTFLYPYLESLSHEKSIQTQWEYTKDIQLFCEFLLYSKIINKDSIKEITLKDLSKLSEKEIYLFMNHLTKFQKEFITTGGNKTVQTFRNGPKGKERKRVSVSNLCNFFVDLGHLHKNPVAGVKISIEEEEQHTSPLPKGTVSLMIKKAQENPVDCRRLRNVVIIKLLAYTGMKVSELVDMDVEDVWETRDEIVITRRTGEEDVIPVLSTFKDELYSYKKMRLQTKNIQKGHNQGLFISQLMRRMDPRSVRKMIKVIVDELGLDVVITPHSFRRSFSEYRYDQGIDLDSTADILGYNNVNMAKKHIK